MCLWLRHNGHSNSAQYLFKIQMVHRLMFVLQTNDLCMCVECSNYNNKIESNELICPILISLVLALRQYARYLNEHVRTCPVILVWSNNKSLIMSKVIGSVSTFFPNVCRRLPALFTTIYRLNTFNCFEHYLSIYSVKIIEFRHKTF